MSVLSTPSLDATAAFLRTLPAIRARCAQVHDRAREGALEWFEYDPGKLEEVIAFCASIVERDYGTAYETIPPHGRWRHLDAGRPRIAPLLAAWTAAGVDVVERCKRLLDLSLVSVLLDAGAGHGWSYVEPGVDADAGTGTYTRSEGLAVASVHMFSAGFFSGSRAQPYRVDALGLARITVDSVAEAMHVGPTNPMVGLEGRTALLVRLADALRARPDYFGDEARAGNLLDFLTQESHPDGPGRRVHIGTLWTVLIETLASVWPSRVVLAGVALGDVWPCPALRRRQPEPESGVSAPDEVDPDTLVPFHKLTSWLAYSLVEPVQALLGWRWDGLEDMTGLPEYRNGGLLIDFGVLTLRPGVLPRDTEVPRLPADHPAIVEWRAMTVIELDRIADGLRAKLGLDAHTLTLAQVLESATWKGGREIARARRPHTGGPPIDIISDGTVF